VEFRLLGPVEVLEDGEPLPLGGPKQRALLALLLLHANDPVSRDALIDGLWGSRPPRSAGHMVDDYVSRLRKQVGAQRVVRKAPGYKLLVEPGELDLDRFDEFALRGRAALAAGQHAEASTRLTEALAVWRGTALVDVVFEPFASVESARLEELRTGVLEDRFEADLARGGGEELVPELEAAVREQPLRERLVGELMLALYRSGRQTAALEAYRALRHRLADELGLEPSPQLRELERRILEHDPTLAAAPRTAAIPWPRRRRHLVAVGALLFAALAVAGSLALWLRGGSSVSAQPAQNELLQLSPAGRIERTSAVADAPTAAAPGPSSLWVSDASGHQLLRANQTSGVVVDRVPLPSAPGNLVVGGGSVWVADSNDASLRRIDVATDGLTERTPLPSIPGGLAYGGGSVWVGDPADRTVLRVDPATGEIAQTLKVGIAPSAIAFGAGLLWVASFADDTVIEVDPVSRSTIATLNVGGGPTALLYVNGFVWVANELDGTVARVNPQTGAVTNTIPTG
jgi:DNA-binding SARP family transcriptional activator